MNAWNQFKSRGDDWLAFLTLVGVAAQGQTGLLSPQVMQWIIFGTSVLTIAHKVFFPTQPVKPAGA